jgi:phenylacetate-CoA ligase
MSTLRGIVWPRLDAIAAELDRTQWLPAGELAAAQQRQLAELLRHAPTAPHYEDALRGWDGRLETVPILTRDAAIAAGTRLASRRYPTDHGDTAEVVTSRTTGEPVRMRTTAVTQRLWRALTLRDHAWHRRDLRAKLAVIRHTAEPAPPPHGARRRGWGPATDALVPDAPLVVLSVQSTTDEQIAWLRAEAPAYLLVYPTVVEAIARRLGELGERLPALREVRTISEALSSDTRALCRDILGVPVVDTYSAEEVGYLGLQCPDASVYHVPETVLVEVLRDDHTPCGVGEIGRVVVTSLHNFATPVVRYELGDYAEVGAPCACGRNLPVLTRVLGRRRGMLHHRDGSTTWPVFTTACRRAARFRELQLVQDGIDALRLRVVADPHAGPIDPRALVAAIHGTLGATFKVTVEVVDAIARSPAGKLEEFVSRL